MKRCDNDYFNSKKKLPLDYKKLLRALPKKAKATTASTKKFFKRIEKRAPKNFSNTVMQLNKEVFTRIDCMQCANCCKKGTPVFHKTDIVRLANHVGMTPADFEKKYLNFLRNLKLFVCKKLSKKDL